MYISVNTSIYKDRHRGHIDINSSPNPQLGEFFDVGIIILLQTSFKARLFS